MRPYQERPFTRSISDDIPRGNHPRGYLAPMRGQRGGAPGTQANRRPPVPQYPRSPPQAHQQVRGMGGEESRYNQEQFGQKSPPRRDPNLHYQQQVLHQPHRVPVETPRPASHDNYTPPVSGHENHPPPMPGQGTHYPGGRPVDRSENLLIQNISDDISQAAAYVQSEGSVILISSIDDSRPLDSNLICPMCNKQFRIGQIQPYKRHVDECRRTPVGQSENPLIQNISHDEILSQAAAYVQSEGSVISMSSIEDPRPLDSNLICPLCKVQFRIGQIQPFKRHVEECHGTRN